MNPVTSVFIGFTAGWLLSEVKPRHVWRVVKHVVSRLVVASRVRRGVCTWCGTRPTQTTREDGRTWWWCEPCCLPISRLGPIGTPLHDDKGTRGAP